MGGLQAAPQAPTPPLGAGAAMLQGAGGGVSPLGLGPPSQGLPPLSALNSLGGGGGGPLSGLLSGNPGTAASGGSPLLGGGGLGSLSGMSSASQTPPNIQQLQMKAVQDAKLDALCPGKERKSTDVGSQCWSTIWENGGCKADNVPAYEQWHQIQSLEVLVADVVQWANLPTERHRQGCFGDAGGGLSGGLGQGMLQAQQQQQQGGGLSSEATQKLQAALESPNLPGVCPGLTRQSTAVGEACWKNIWKHVGCLEDTPPPYEDWHNTQSMEVLVADGVQWATLPSERHQRACYGDQGAAQAQSMAS